MIFNDDSRLTELDLFRVTYRKDREIKRDKVNSIGPRISRVTEEKEEKRREKNIERDREIERDGRRRRH